VKEILRKSNVHPSTKMIQTWRPARKKFVDRPADGACRRRVSPSGRLLLLADNESGMMRGSAILFSV
jgi:hypothetical protein